MAQPTTAQLPSTKSNIVLAISALNQNRIWSVNRAAQLFTVSESTLRSRRAGVPSRRDCKVNSKKLTELKEEVIISYILNLDSRGFAPTLSAVQDIANKLLATRDAG